MESRSTSTTRRIQMMEFARVYPLYIAKVERKGHTQAEVDEIIRWLTGYSQKGLEAQIKRQVTEDSTKIILV